MGQRTFGSQGIFSWLHRNQTYAVFFFDSLQLVFLHEQLLPLPRRAEEHLSEHEAISCALSWWQSGPIQPALLAEYLTLRSRKKKKRETGVGPLKQGLADANHLIQKFLRTVWAFFA